MNLKTLARTVVASAHSLAGAGLDRLRGKVVILMYHRVLPDQELSGGYVQPGMYVREAVFRMHMEFLKENFEVLSFHALLELWSLGEWDEAKRYCVITFDDGWIDNYIHAFPVLREMKLAATIFLPTAMIGTDRWFWPDELGFLLAEKTSSAQIGSLLSDYGLLRRNGVPLDPDSVIEDCKRLESGARRSLIEAISRETGLAVPRTRVLMNWGEVAEMSEAGISFGSHTASHAMLTQLPVDTAEEELEASINALRARSVNHVPVFCYPNGNYTPAIAEMVRRAGYAAAVTTKRGPEGAQPADIFAIRRIGIHNDVSSTMPLFAYHLAR